LRLLRCMSSDSVAPTEALGAKRARGGRKIQGAEVSNHASQIGPMDRPDPMLSQWRTADCSKLLIVEKIRSPAAECVAAQNVCGQGTACQRFQVLRVWVLAKCSILLTFAAEIFFDIRLDINSQSAQRTNNDPVAAYRKGSFNASMLPPISAP
jgi:hypothetical protein